MKRSLFIAILLTAITAKAQFSPEDYETTHSDSCWHFTFDYNTPKMPKDAGMIVITHLCTPDTCISSTTRHLQGKRYARRYIKRYGNRPELQTEGTNSYTLSIPEENISDTVYAITYSEYNNGKDVEFICDTLMICMPECPPMSCHRVKPRHEVSGQLAMKNPHVHSMRNYVPLTSGTAAEMPITPSIVRYVTNSSKLNPDYLDNASSIEEFMRIIDELLADSSTHIESVQIAGYTSPNSYNREQLGEARARAMRNHICMHKNLPDSVFEIAAGGTSWEMLYSSIREIEGESADTLIATLKKEDNTRKREDMLKRYKNGTLYSELATKTFPNMHMACCTGVYYSKQPDSTAIALNRIVDELINTPSPDYRRLIGELKQYNNDPRALNLQGVIDYRRHHRHAAEKAFTKAAALGDEQAAINLQIVTNNKKVE